MCSIARAEARPPASSGRNAGMWLRTSIVRSRTAGVSPQTNSSQSGDLHFRRQVRPYEFRRRPLRHADEVGNAILERQRHDEIDDQCAGPQVAAEHREQFGKSVERYGEEHDVAPGRHLVVGHALDWKRGGRAVQPVDRLARAAGVA